MNDLHVVVGAGPVGTATAELLLARGQRVRVLTRSGSGPTAADRRAVDAADADALSAAAEGAVAIYNAANPAYHRWPQDWPPVAAALLVAAERTGAVLVTCSNLYGYGPVDGVLTPDLPLVATTVKGRVRAQMWADALAAHEAGRIRATEVRGSDYVGHGTQSHLERVLPRVVAGKAVRVLGDPDARHAWTYVGDMAATLVAAADDPRAWGRAWHTPITTTLSQRAALADFARAAGQDPVTVGRMPAWVVRAGGVVSPMLRELPEMAYQLDRPFLVDDRETRTVLGVAPTPWDEVVARSVAAVRADAGTGSAAA